MTLGNLKQKINTPYFFNHQVERAFPEESKHSINIQLSRMLNRGNLVALKRGLYIFTDEEVSEFTISNLLYSPSYVSLESALNIYGIIPDIVQNVTAVTPTTTKNFNTSKGTYLYSKITSNLFFGYTYQKIANLYYKIAKPEKALLDYIYVRKISDLSSSRLNFDNIRHANLQRFMPPFPGWVKSVIYEQYNK